MAAIGICPNRNELQQLAHGLLSADRLDEIAGHVEQCPGCVATLSGIRSADTLIDAVQGSSVIDRPTSQVNAVIERLCKVPGVAQPQTAALSVGRQSSPNPPVGESTDSHEPLDFLAPAQLPDEIGRLGPYRILKVLGVGGMGVVFQAEDPQLKRSFALKTMKPAIAANPKHRQRFLREAQAAARVESDHIVPIYQVGEERGVPYLAMPLLKGSSLEQRLTKGKPMSVPQVLRLALQAARGLATAHEAGLVHRDIKPANLWIEEASPGCESGDSRIKILDFGLARAVADAGLTQSGAIVGTPAYMAPEQARGDQVDARADLFSLGCVMYRMLTGEQPFQRDETMATLMALALNEPPPAHQVNPAVPAALSELVAQLMAKTPTARPGTATAVVERLLAIEKEFAPPKPAHEAIDTSRERQRAEDAASLNRTPALAPRKSSMSRRVALAAAMILVGALVAWQIIRIKDKDGNTIAEFKLPKDGSVWKDDKKIADKDAPDGTRDKPAVDPAVIKPDPLPPLKGGEPLSPIALVGRPAKIEGVRSWTIETRGHRGAIYWMEYSPDGKYLATPGHGDGTVRLWDAETGKLLNVLLGHTANVNGLRWSPDSRTVLTTSEDYTARLWDAATGRALHVLLGHEGIVCARAWTRDGKRVATGSHDKTVRVWDTVTGKQLQVLEGHTGFLQEISWSADGKTVRSVSQDKAVREWDAGTGRSKKEVSLDLRSVGSVAFSPDGRRIAVTSQDDDQRTNVVLCDAETARMVHRLPSEYQYPSQLAWSHDGKYLAFRGSEKDSIGIWDTATRKLHRQIVAPNLSSKIGGIALSRDGKTIAVGDEIGSLHFFDTASGEETRAVAGHEERIGGTAWSTDATTLVMAAPFSGQHNDNYFWSTRNGERTSILGRNRARFSWSADGKRIAIGDGNGGLTICDSSTFKPVHELRGHIGGISALAWTPDGKMLASGNAWGAGAASLRVWDTETGKPIAAWMMMDQNTNVNCVAWSPDQKILVSGHADGTIQICRLGEKEPVRWKTEQSSVSSVGWSPDGKCVVSGGTGLTMKLWDAASGKLLEVFKGHKSEVNHLGWMSDGKTIWSHSINDKTLRHWDSQTGQLLKTISLPAQGELSADRRLLASSRTCVTQLWEVETGLGRGSLVRLRNDHWLAIHPDGHYRGTPRVERELVYVAQLDDGSQITLTPEEFEKRFKWKNDPDKVRLIGK